jgi:hypothetical protein
MARPKYRIAYHGLLIMALGTLKSDPYSNFKMLSPEGILMNRTSAKRAEWYVARGLAEWVDDTTYQLTFIPNGLGRHNDPFYTNVSVNRCVVCGTEDNLTKHHVVPYMFRKLFPKYCANNHHDILVVCLDDHEDYERHADKLKETLLAPYEPLITEYNRILRSNNKIEGARKCYESIKDNPHVPFEKLQAIKEEGEQEIVALPETWHSSFLRNHSTEQSIHELFCTWRKHFVEYAQPNYLPKHWDISHSLERWENS